MVTNGNAIRGTRVGAGPIRWSERGDQAPRQQVTYWCANGHRTDPSFAAEVPVPDVWDCTRCGLPAGRDSAAPPEPPRPEPYKTHLAYVKERRSEEDGEALLAEALERLHQRRN